MSDPINVFELANGLRVVHQQVKSTQLVHCAVGINAGTRDESKANNGAAHFIEHAVFKGTEKRKPYQLFNLIESVGGEINAYTTRENTFFYSSSLKRYLNRNLELLSDLVFNPVFDPKELDKERKVILEEIEMYQDSPEDSIYDDFFLNLYKEQPLGLNILGTPESLANIGRKELADFRTKFYTQPNLVLSICGNVTLNKAKLLAERHFAELQLSNGATKRKPATISAPFAISEEKDFFQSHSIIGSPAYSRFDENRFPLMVLNNILGGQSMSSRLNLNVREKHGYVYHISSAYTAFEDTGVFMIQYGCDEANQTKTQNIIKRELKKLKTKKLGSVQLNIAKRQLQGQLAMLVENPSYKMQSSARAILNYGQIMPIEAILNKIESVSADQILNVANQVFNDGQMSQFIYLSNK
ncbi:MAG: insulinase family protein [Bacteroidetes bacterium]|nr:insulinase family protein [Bacteroidota bacterium]